MIQYKLRCAEGHDFDSWFQSAAAFEALQKAGHVSCAVCGATDVSKALMAPSVSTADRPAPPKVSEQKKKRADMLAALRKHVEENASYVGADFASEARSMYLGATPERAIYGEATGKEAKSLIDDGIPVAPLPFLPTRKAN
ncbi:DUF1178 family protein [Sulfitobacter sp. D35]|uniref:DUF1178 family protein n=1 Tax=Sulfitobacter sp. D35 TaxID=3083252 RepID=UPI00296F31F2|nr:DUF1178 family protein [Sulfitobacter sp. D35]MDW4497066.1 DUF1178 family protein [Sulfitobacter sp. D35]